MDYFYSQSTNGFYTVDMHGGGIPDDAVKIAADHHALLLRGQAAGKKIGPDETGFPILFDLPPPAPRRVFSVREFFGRFTIEEQLAIRRSQLTDMEVGLVYDDFNRAEVINIEDPAVAVGIDLYVAKGLLLASRRDEILAPEAVVAF